MKLTCRTFFLITVSLTIFFALAHSSTATSGKIRLNNGPSIFTDSTGASWNANNLTLTITPGVVNNPFAQVGENFSNRVIAKTDPLLPANIVGLDFNLNFEPNYPSWVFVIATYDLPYTGNNTGVIFVCNDCVELVGEVQTGYIDKSVDPTDAHLRTIKSSNGKIRLDFDHNFFRDADAYSMAFQVTPASLPSQETAFTFSDIKWITHD